MESRKCRFKEFGLSRVDIRKPQKNFRARRDMICVLNLFYEEKPLLVVKTGRETDDEGPREPARMVRAFHLELAVPRPI